MIEAPPDEPPSRLVSNIRITDRSPASAAKPTEDVPHVDTGKLGDRETRHRTGLVETKVAEVADALSDMPPEEGVKALATMASTDPPADRKSGVKLSRKKKDADSGSPGTTSESGGSPPRKPPDKLPTPGAPDDEPDKPTGDPTPGSETPARRATGGLMNRLRAGADTGSATPEAKVHIDETPLTPAEQERLTVIRNEHFGRSYEVGGKLHVIDNIDDKGTIYSSTFEDGKRKEHIHPRGEKADEYSELLRASVPTPEVEYEGSKPDPAVIFAETVKYNLAADGVGGMIRLRGRDGKPGQLLMIRSVTRGEHYGDNPLLEIVRTRRNADGELTDDPSMKYPDASQVHLSTVSELKSYLKSWNAPAESRADKLKKLLRPRARRPKGEESATTTPSTEPSTPRADDAEQWTGTSRVRIKERRTPDKEEPAATVSPTEAEVEAKVDTKDESTNVDEPDIEPAPYEEKQEAAARRDAMLGVPYYVNLIDGKESHRHLIVIKDIKDDGSLYGIKKDVETGRVSAYERPKGEQADGEADLFTKTGRTNPRRYDGTHPSIESVFDKVRIDDPPGSAVGECISTQDDGLFVITGVDHTDPENPTVTIFRTYRDDREKLYPGYTKESTMPLSEVEDYIRDTETPTPTEEQKITEFRNKHLGRSYKLPDGQRRLIDDTDQFGTVDSSTFNVEKDEWEYYEHARGEKSDQYSKLLEASTPTPEILYDGTPESSIKLSKLMDTIKNDPAAGGIGEMIRFPGSDGKPDQLLMISGKYDVAPYTPEDPLLHIVVSRRNKDGELVEYENTGSVKASELKQHLEKLNTS